MRGQNEAAHAVSFIKSITCLTGIAESMLKKYAAENNVFNILEHPNAIGVNPQQLEKIHLLNEFISTYQILKLQEKEEKNIAFTSTSLAGQFFVSLLGATKDRERFMAILLDTGHHIIETRTFSEGSIEETPVYPRMILKAALNCDCKSIIFAHNHPGGSLIPSELDRDLTKNLVSIFTPLQISVLDHIIVADTQYYSMAERGGMPAASSKIRYEATLPYNNQCVGENALSYGYDSQDDYVDAEDQENELEI